MDEIVFSSPAFAKPMLAAFHAVVGGEDSAHSYFLTRTPTKAGKGLQYTRAADLDQISYLPLWHIFGHLYSGCAVAASERTTWKNGKGYAAAMSK